MRGPVLTAVAQLFAARHPRDVAGLVLVDAVHPDHRIAEDHPEAVVAAIREVVSAARVTSEP